LQSAPTFSNREALDASLETVAGLDVDEVVLLGDILGSHKARCFSSHA
jgi:hypothetical protein